MNLQRPDGLDDASWEAVDVCGRRLEMAQRQHDISLVIGTAKEFVECVAKVVLSARGETIGSNADMSEVIGRAHQALQRQPGEGLATDPPTRDLAQAAKSVALKLGDLRNHLGTGHGRATPPEVKEEHAMLAADSASLWVRWALRRLEHLISGLPSMLARDLVSGRIFHSGSLRTRLVNADLPRLDEGDQRTIGLAVAHRSLQDTFVVIQDGVDACADDSSLEKWPPGYRAGLVEGLFINREGLIDPTPRLVAKAAQILNPLPSAREVIDHVAAQARQAELSYRLQGDADLRQMVQAAIRESASHLPEGGARDEWINLTEVLETRPESM